MLSLRIPRGLVAGSVLVVAAACGGSDSPTAPKPVQPTQGLKAVAGGGVTDTVLSAPLQALVVEVRGAGGTLAKGVTVRFSVQAPADTTRRYEQTMYVCALAATTCGPNGAYNSLGGPGANVSTDTADANGRAKALLRLGTVAGPTYVIVTVPELGMKDSVPFTVTAGAPKRMTFATPDVPLTVGGTATLRAAVTDTYGNPRTDAVAYSLGNPSGVVTLTGATLAAVDIGSVYAFARAGAAVDSALVRVIPAGRLLVWEAGTQSVRMVNTDGTAPRLLASGVSSDFGAFPRFSPSGGTLAFHAGATSAYGGVPSRVVVMDSLGGSQREIPLPSGVSSITQPRPLADGTVLVVGRGAAQYNPNNPTGGYVTPTAVYSIKPDGTVAKVGDLPSASVTYGGVDISRDGTRVAFIVDQTGGYAGSGPYGQSGPLQVLTLSNGQVTQVASVAASPTWSPSGDRLAYLVPSNTYGFDGTLAVVNADGGAPATLSSAGTFSPGLAWSPAGTYVLGRSTNFDGLRAVRVLDGSSVLLKLPAIGSTFPGSVADYYQPDWR